MTPDLQKYCRISMVHRTAERIRKDLRNMKIDSKNMIVQLKIKIFARVAHLRASLRHGGQRNFFDTALITNPVG